MGKSKCGKVSPACKNVTTALQALNIFTQLIASINTTNAGVIPITAFTNLFAPNGTFTFNATAPIIPFGGTFTVATLPQFFVALYNSIVVSNISTPLDVAVNQCGTSVYIAVNVTSSPRCSPTAPLGPTATLQNILQFQFNPCGQIQSIGVYADTSGLAAYYLTTCIVA